MGTPIKMTKVGDLFTATAESLVRGIAWETPEPMPIDDLIHRLQELGFHPTDIGDALFFADNSFMADHPVVQRHPQLRASRAKPEPDHE